MDIENQLEELEDSELEVRVKRKEHKDHKIEEDDFFYRIRIPFNNYSKICRIKSPSIEQGSFIIIATSYGNEIAIVQGIVKNIDEVLSQDEIIAIVRIATDEDKSKYQNNLKREAEAYNITQEKIIEHKLNMKLVNVHYFLDDSKILFNFTADGRVDFRDLVKDLASIFKTRIELRQIGVRDECRIIGGYGQCGRHFCCSNVSNELEPITIKMAKEQNLTLNSLKISGICGRLLCCLAYEYPTYCKEKERYPEIGSKVKYGNELFSVEEINIQTGMIKISGLSNGSQIFNNVKLEDIEIKK